MNRRYLVAVLLQQAPFLPKVAPLLFLLVFVATSVEAAIFGTAALVKDPANGVPFASPDAALGAPWTSYVIGLESTDGELIQAIEASFTGPFHQRWTLDEDQVFPTPTSVNQTNGDSHLLAGNNINVLFYNSPVEDNSGLDSPLPDNETRDYGLGTYLRGSWAFVGSALPTAADVAYVVIPKGQEGAVQFHIRAFSPEGDIIADLQSCSHFFTCVDGPVVDVSGNGVHISSGDVTPSLLDDTDFGDVLPGSMQLRTFTLEVTGVGPLELQPPVFGGPFSLVGDFPTSIDGGNVDFTVAFDTNAGLGEHLGSLSFAHNGLNASPYNFALHARITPEPTSGMLVLPIGVGSLLLARRSKEGRQ